MSSKQIISTQNSKKRKSGKITAVSETMFCVSLRTDL